MMCELMTSSPVITLTSTCYNVTCCVDCLPAPQRAAYRLAVLAQLIVHALHEVVSLLLQH